MNPIAKTFVYTFVLCFSCGLAEAARHHEDSYNPDWAKLAPSDGYDPTKDKGAHEMRPASELIFVEDYDELRRWAREGYTDKQDELVQRFGEGVLILDKEADLADFWEWEGLDQRILTQPGYMKIICLYCKDEREDKLPGLKGRLLALLDRDPTDPLSQYFLGYCYYFGLFFAQNDTEAAKWFLRAAEQGHALGQYCYGVMCSNGKGVQRSDKEAEKWYLKAAEKDLAMAQSNYGVMCRKGRGVPRNDKEAAKWYLRAAIQELAVAQYYYGLVCKKGIGVPRNEKEAKGWFEKAAAQGHEKAKQKLRELT